MDEYRIRSAITAIIKSEQLPLLGARLGTLIRKSFPESASLDIRTQYGGLKAMIRQCAGDLLEPIGKQGVDDLYDSPVHPGHGFVAASVSDATKESAWAMWHNPQLKGQVLFDPDASALVTAKGAENEARMVNVPRVSNEDQQAMITEFVRMIEAATGPITIFEEVKAASADKCWDTFHRALSSTGQLAKWIPFRRQYLRELLHNRLVKLDLDETSVKDVVERTVNASKALRHVRAIPPPNHSGTEVSERHFSGIAELAKHAIGQMSEAQLEDLRVPLGAIWRALGKA
jgi:hypothetical protein